MVRLQNYLLFIFLTSILGCNFNPQSGRWSNDWEEKYESFQPSRTILDSINIQEGMKVAEIGAGNGRFAVKVAQRVGLNGCVYANDIDMRAILFMKNRIKRERIKNVIVRKGSTDDPNLPEDYFDLVYVINSYSHFKHPELLLRNIRRSLLKNGRLIIIEYSPEKLKSGYGHTTSKKKIISDASKAGYSLVSLKDFLVYDNIYVFEIAGYK